MPHVRGTLLERTGLHGEQAGKDVDEGGEHEGRRKGS